jgi:hypothetical protein
MLSDHGHNFKPGSPMETGWTVSISNAKSNSSSNQSTCLCTLLTVQQLSLLLVVLDAIQNDITTTDFMHCACSHMLLHVHAFASS